MTRRLAAYVTVRDETGSRRTLGPDDEVPAWAAALITNPAAWAPSSVEATTSATTATGTSKTTKARSKSTVSVP